MSFLRNIRLKLHYYRLNSKMKRNTVERYSMSFDKAQSIGILYDATQPEHEATIQKYRRNLQQSGKKVEMLAYVHEPQEADEATSSHQVHYLHRKQLTWTLEPKSSAVDTFINTPFDILLGLHIDGSQPLEYIAALSKAHLRVGQYRDNREFCYDLIIDTPPGDSLQNFIGQVDYYIKNLNKG